MKVPDDCMATSCTILQTCEQCYDTIRSECVGKESKKKKEDEDDQKDVQVFLDRGMFSELGRSRFVKVVAV